MMNKFQGWDLIDKLPEGWVVDQKTGSPLHGYVFVTNGKNVIAGQKRALLRVMKPQRELPLDVLFSVPVPQDAESISEKTKPEFIFNATQARTVNELARQRFKEQLLNDILVDLQICEIEGWGKLDYIRELKSMICSLGKGRLLIGA